MKFKFAISLFACSLNVMAAGLALFDGRIKCAIFNGLCAVLMATYAIGFYVILKEGSQSK